MVQIWQVNYTLKKKKADSRNRSAVILYESSLLVGLQTPWKYVHCGLKYFYRYVSYIMKKADEDPNI